MLPIPVIKPIPIDLLAGPARLFMFQACTPGPMGYNLKACQLWTLSLLECILFYSPETSQAYCEIAHSDILLDLSSFRRQNGVCDDHSNLRYNNRRHSPFETVRDY